MTTRKYPHEPHEGERRPETAEAAATKQVAALEGKIAELESTAAEAKDRYLRLAAGPNRLREEDIRQIGEPIKSVATPFNLIPEFQNLRI